MIRYQFIVEGTADDGQMWATTGAVNASGPAALPQVAADAIRDSFDQLTQGKAVYGQPGKGCRGPYTVQRLVIERLDDLDATERARDAYWDQKIDERKEGR